MGLISELHDPVAVLIPTRNRNAALTESCRDLELNSPRETRRGSGSAASGPWTSRTRRATVRKLTSPSMPRTRTLPGRCSPRASNSVNPCDGATSRAVATARRSGDSASGRRCSNQRGTPSRCFPACAEYGSSSNCWPRTGRSPAGLCAQDSDGSKRDRSPFLTRTPTSSSPRSTTARPGRLIDTDDHESGIVRATSAGWSSASGSASRRRCSLRRSSRSAARFLRNLSVSPCRSAATAASEIACDARASVDASRRSGTKSAASIAGWSIRPASCGLAGVTRSRSAPGPSSSSNAPTSTSCPSTKLRGFKDERSARFIFVAALLS